jgi:uncharacterized membrane protein affecting hemolysin expression
LRDAGAGRVKLPSRSDLVKPQRATLTIAAVTAVVTVLAVHILLIVTDPQQGRMDRFGTAAARALAELAVEPLMRQDRMHLGVIGNRLAETAEISGVASYTADNELLTSTGDMAGPQYSQPVTVDDSIVGYVRLALHPPAFVQAYRARLLALLAVAVLVAVLVATGWTVAGAVRRGELAAVMPQRPRWLRTSSPAPTAEKSAAAKKRAAANNRAAAKKRTTAADDATADDATQHSEAENGTIGDSSTTDRAAGTEIRHYLLAVNLYNQLSMEPNEREFELSLCAELAEAVAEIYQGQVVKLPGVGVLVDFDHTGDDDRPFQILCAAFVLSRLLDDETPFGTYRLGLNLAVRPADQPLPLDDASIADAALLSALAKDAVLAISAPYAGTLEDEPRAAIRALVNPLLDELTTSSPGCYLVTSLKGAFATRVIQQAEQLKSQRDPISSPSTF